MSNARTKKNSKLQKILFEAIEGNQLAILKFFVSGNQPLIEALSRQSLAANIEYQSLVHQHYANAVTALWQKEIPLMFLHATLAEFIPVVEDCLNSDFKNEKIVINALRKNIRKNLAALTQTLEAVFDRDEGAEIAWKGRWFALKNQSGQFILVDIQDCHFPDEISLSNGIKKKVYGVKVAGEGNAGLTALNINKKNLITHLRQAINLSQNRETLAIEIKSVLMDLSHKHCNRLLSPGEVPAAERLLSAEWTNLYLQFIELLSREEQQKQTLRMLEYCARFTVCQEYIEEYAKTNTSLWLGKKSAHLYAVMTKKILWVFDQRENSLELDRESSHFCERPEPPLCLVYDALGHFNLLEEVDQKEDPRSRLEAYIHWFKAECGSMVQDFLVMPSNQDWDTYYHRLIEKFETANTSIEDLCNQKNKLTFLLNEAANSKTEFLAYQQTKKQQWLALSKKNKQAIRKALQGNLKEAQFYAQIETIAVPPDFSDQEKNTLLHKAIYFNFKEASDFLISQGANVLKPNAEALSPFTLSATRLFCENSDKTQDKAGCLAIWSQAKKLSLDKVDSKYLVLAELSKLFTKLFKELIEYEQIQQTRMQGNFFQTIKKLAAELFYVDKTSDRFLTVSQIYTLAEIARAEQDYIACLKELDSLLAKMELEWCIQHSELYTRLKNFSKDAHACINNNQKTYQEDYRSYHADEAKKPEIEKATTLKKEIEREEKIQRRRVEILARQAKRDQHATVKIEQQRQTEYIHLKEEMNKKLEEQATKAEKAELRVAVLEQKLLDHATQTTNQQALLAQQLALMMASLNTTPTEEKKPKDPEDGSRSPRPRLQLFS